METYFTLFKLILEGKLGHAGQLAAAKEEKASLPSQEGRQTWRQVCKEQGQQEQPANWEGPEDSQLHRAGDPPVALYLSAKSSQQCAYLPFRTADAGYAVLASLLQPVSWQHLAKTAYTCPVAGPDPAHPQHTVRNSQPK